MSFDLNPYINSLPQRPLRGVAPEIGETVWVRIPGRRLVYECEVLAYRGNSIRMQKVDGSILFVDPSSWVVLSRQWLSEFLGIEIEAPPKVSSERFTQDLTEGLTTEGLTATTAGVVGKTVAQDEELFEDVSLDSVTSTKQLHFDDDDFA